MIPVTKPFLPPKEEYDRYLKAIWSRNWLTNNGPLVNDLELKLKSYFDVNHLILTSNGTIALQIAIKSLDIEGEIITTPFSYVATTSAIVWEGCKPVFVDIDKLTWNIDPQLIQEAITEKTSAILATHVFGNPCDIAAIAKIAQKHDLKVIYDAAHGFGSSYKKRSIMGYGDVTATSFHATKLYHTIEGGALITSNPHLLQRMAYMRKFGHDGPGKFNGVGINGKNSEVHAAMGLSNLQYVAEILAKRKSDVEHYKMLLAKAPVTLQAINSMGETNYSYFPVLFENESVLLKVEQLLNAHEIFPRRYFYPGLNELDYVGNYQLPVSDDITRRVLCLPLFYEITNEEIEMVCRYILKVLNN